MNPNLLASAAAPHLVQLADLDENKVTPGLLGFVVFALIGGATWLLMKNMAKQLKRIDFEPAPAEAPGQDPAAPPDRSEVAANAVAKAEAAPGPKPDAKAKPETKAGKAAPEGD